MGRRLWRRSPRRTLLLGVVALGALLWGAVSQFDIPRERVLDTLLALLLSLALIIVLAALGAGAWIALRRVLSRGDDGDR